MEVLACPGSGEEPRAFGACCCSEVRAVPKVLSEDFRERLWNGHRMRAKGDGDRAHVVDVHSVGAERGHPDQWLGIEDEQCPGDSVGQGLAGACEQLAVSYRRSNNIGLSGGSCWWFAGR